MSAAVASPMNTAANTANTVDHIVEVEKGGSDDPRNLRAVCPQCHNRRHSERGSWDRD